MPHTLLTTLTANVPSGAWTGSAIRDCTTCKFKDTSGCMVAPCFECLDEHDIYTGEPKHKYNEWRDERLSWEEIQKQDREFYEELDRLFLPNDKLTSGTGESAA